LLRSSMSRGEKPYQSDFRSDFLKGKVALVTGGGSGIGLAITEAFARHGANVAIASRDEQKLNRAAQDLRNSTGVQCVACPVDIRQSAKVESMVDEVLAKLGRIDILVNSAAGNFLSSAEALSYNAFKNVLDIDTVGTYNVSRAVFLKWMKKHGGKIVNITATLHWTGEALQSHAGAAKAGVEALARHFANEWGRYGIRVNNLAPGPIEDTVGFEKLGGFLSAELQKHYTGRIALQRFGLKSDVAQTALYLVSSAGDYVTGTTIPVDGGAWMTTGGLVAFALEQNKKKVDKSRPTSAPKSKL